MKRMFHQNQPAPKYIRVVIFLDRIGTVTCRFTSNYSKTAWQVELANLATKGFKPFDSFRIPFRYWLANFNRGATHPAYQYWLKWAVRNIGI